MKYIRGIKELTITFEPDSNPQLWVDSSYAVHSYLKSHMGLDMSIGIEATYPSSCYRKIYTKAEQVGNDDTMGQVLWTHHFQAGQGIFVPTTTIHQGKKVQYCHQKIENYK